MAESPAPPISEKLPIGKLGLEPLGVEPCDPASTDQELCESIEKELLEVAIVQAEIEAARGRSEDKESFVREDKPAVDCGDDENGGDKVGEDAQIGQGGDFGEEKDGKHGENVEGEILDEEDGRNEEGLSGEEVMKLGRHSRGNNRRKNSYPMRPDAEDCPYYMKFGSCKFGFSCKFNHPPRRKNQVKEKAKQREENSAKAGQTECKYYLTSGGCKYGKDCKYSHGPDKSSSSNNPEFNFLGLPIRPDEKECPYYMRNGSCKYGSNCRFHHPEPKAVAGGSSPSQYGNGGSHSSQLVSVQSASSWSSPMTFTDTPPFVPVKFPPTQGGAAPTNEWNGYQSVAYPAPEKRLPTPPAFAMNNLPTELSFPKQWQGDMVVEEYPERPGELECSFFLKTGDCKFKSNCKFHHPKNRNSHTKVNSFSLNDKGLPLRPDQPICAHYHRYGICKYGPACKYDHPPKFAISPSPDPPPMGNAVDGAETSRQENEAESSV